MPAICLGELSKRGPSCLCREKMISVYPLSPWELPASFRREKAPSTHTQCSCQGLNRRFQTKGICYGNLYKFRSGKGVSGAGCGGVSVLCIPLSSAAGTPRGQYCLFSSPHPCPPSPPKCPEHPSRCCELVCSNIRARGGVAQKACGPPPLGPPVSSMKPNTPPSRPPGHLTPSWGPLRVQAISCLGLGNPLKSRPPSPNPFQMLIKPFANPGLN